MLFTLTVIISSQTGHGRSVEGKRTTVKTPSLLKMDAAVGRGIRAGSWNWVEQAGLQAFITIFGPALFFL